MYGSFIKPKSPFLLDPIFGECDFIFKFPLFVGSIYSCKSLRKVPGKLLIVGLCIESE